jgi:hypothetical protein
MLFGLEVGAKDFGEDGHVGVSVDSSRGYKVCKLYHLSTLNLSDYRSEWQPMVLSEEPLPKLVNEALVCDRPVAAVGEACWINDMELVCGLDLALCWHGAYFELCVTKMVHEPFIPANCAVQALQGDAGSLFLVWDPNKKRRNKSAMISDWAALALDDCVADDGGASDAGESDQDWAENEFGDPSHDDVDSVSSGIDSVSLRTAGSVDESLLFGSVGSRTPERAESPPPLPPPAVEPVAERIEPPLVPPGPDDDDDDAGDDGAPTLIIPGFGSIKYYENKSRSMYALCPNRDHGPKCRLTRTVNIGRRHGQGRCLGRLTAFLMESFNPAFGNNIEHRNFFDDRLPARRAAREQLKLVPGCEYFFALERAKAVGEGSEPDLAP